MRSATSWIIAIIVLIIIVGGGYYLWNSNSVTATSTTPTTGTPTGQTTTVDNAGGTDYTPGNTNTDAPGSLDGSVSAGVGTSNSSATVTYDGSKFTPATVTIAKGGTVHFVASSGSIWVASDVHPSHTDFDGTSRAQHCAAGYTGPVPFDQCAAGSSYSFTFNKSGTFTYHNHVNAGATGTVIVL